MIDSLTPEQEARTQEFIDKWTKRLEQPTNPEATVEHIKLMYRIANLPEPTDIIGVASPIAAQYAHWIANYVMDNDEVKRLAEKCANPLTREAGMEECRALGFGDKPREHHSFQDYGGCGDYGWVSYYDYFNQVVGIQYGELQQQYIDSIYAAGMYDSLLYATVAIYCCNPIHLTRSDRNAPRLHNADEAAIRWADGAELFFWHGVQVPRRYIMDKDGITREDVMKEQNAERRRALREILGSERWAELLGTVVIDEDTDNKGYTMRLLKSAERDAVIDEHLYFLECICPSTERAYFLGVPPTLEPKNVWSAKAWLFEEEAIEYVEET